MRICIIGDSHVAMLLVASQKYQYGAELTFFAKPKLAADDLLLEGSVIRAKQRKFLDSLARLGTSPCLDLASFDAVVIAAKSTTIYSAVRISQSHAITGWPSGQEELLSVLARPAVPSPRQLMTRDSYCAALTELIKLSLSFTLATGLRAASEVPIYFVPRPFPSEKLLDMTGEYPVIKRVIRRGDSAAMADDLNAVNREAFEQIEKTTYVPQATQTIKQGCLSHASYMRDARRLNTARAQPDDDVTHANAEMGHIFLTAIIKNLRYE